MEICKRKCVRLSQSDGLPGWEQEWGFISGPATGQQRTPCVLETRFLQCRTMSACYCSGVIWECQRSFKPLAKEVMISSNKPLVMYYLIWTARITYNICLQRAHKLLRPLLIQMFYRELWLFSFSHACVPLHPIMPQQHRQLQAGAGCSTEMHEGCDGSVMHKCTMRRRALLFCFSRFWAPRCIKQFVSLCMHCWQLSSQEPEAPGRIPEPHCKY